MHKQITNPLTLFFSKLFQRIVDWVSSLQPIRCSIFENQGETNEKNSYIKLRRSTYPEADLFRAFISELYN